MQLAKYCYGHEIKEITYNELNVWGEKKRYRILVGIPLRSIKLEDQEGDGSTS
jgi:hypothetical protein